DAEGSSDVLCCLDQLSWQRIGFRVQSLVQQRDDIEIPRGPHAQPQERQTGSADRDYRVAERARLEEVPQRREKPFDLTWLDHARSVPYRFAMIRMAICDAKRSCLA